MQESTPTQFSDTIRDIIPDEYQQELDKVKPVSQDSFLEMQCQWFNEGEGKLEGYDCTACKNRGYFQIIQDGFAVLKECECMANRRYIQMMNAAGLGELYENCTFDSYTTKADWQARCKAMALRYAADKGAGWMYFGGSSGCGKTHLCTAVCSELAKAGRDIKYLQWKRLYSKLQKMKYKLYEYEELMQECCEANTLYLDDFLKTPNNAEPDKDSLSAALDIIDARYKANLKTIISTEFMIDEIVAFDEALGGRIREKASGHIIQVKREKGRNYRMG